MSLIPLRHAHAGGNDALVKLWACLPAATVSLSDVPPNEAFVGHPSAVLGTSGRVATCVGIPCCPHAGT